MKYDRIRAESERKGIKRRISLPALNATLHKQYDSTSDELSLGISHYGIYNLMEIINRSDCDVKIELDFNPNKYYICPSTGSISIDEETYQSVQIENLAAATNITADDVTIFCSYEMSLERERVVPPRPLRDRIPPKYVSKKLKNVTNISRWM
ncbi:MAG: hypothetical protein SYNGOMJ08_00377 [Candidatus Syntrophoarchaeum sp. GoM_oil]|nr:MAG: hypothetical protein SYNGOMJ08_00377 [Candidatus Syntrophoarchaeum sp. GoM_oil]